MRPKRLLPVVVTLLWSISLWPASLSAGDGFQPIPPEELSLKEVPQAPGAAAVILYRQVDRDDNGTTSNQYNYVRIKILTEEGRKYANVEIPFFQSTGKIVAVHGRTTRPDGSVVNFDGRVFEKSIVKAKGLKYLVKTFTLPDAQVGSIIEYYYTQDLSEHLIYDSHWILNEELFTRRAKFTLKPYRSNYAPISVRWGWQGLPAGSAGPQQGPDRIVRLEVENMAAFQVEDYMPPEDDLKFESGFYLQR